MTMTNFLVDFEQPRALYQDVMDDAARARLVSNIAGHLGGAKSAEVRARTRTFKYDLQILLLN